MCSPEWEVILEIGRRRIDYKVSKQEVVDENVGEVVQAPPPTRATPEGGYEGGLL